MVYFFWRVIPPPPPFPPLSTIRRRTPGPDPPWSGMRPEGSSARPSFFLVIERQVDPEFPFLQRVRVSSFFFSYFPRLAIFEIGFVSIFPPFVIRIGVGSFLCFSFFFLLPFPPGYLSSLAVMSVATAALFFLKH